MLGDDAIANRKLEAGNPLVVLGIRIETNLAGAIFQPAPEKIAEWTLQIRRYLELGIMGAGEASKLAGMHVHIACDVKVRACVSDALQAGWDSRLNMFSTDSGERCLCPSTNT